MPTETYILRIDERPRGPTGNYPVKLFNAATPGTVLATGTIKRNLKPSVAGSWLSRTVIESAAQSDTSDDDTLRAIGRQLFALVPGGPVRDALNQHAAGEARLLLDIRPEDLRSLPWELMQDDIDFVFRDQGCPWSRGNLDQPRNLPPIDVPLRVLVIVGSEPDDTEISAEEEVAALVDALHDVEPQVDLWVERQPSLARVDSLFRSDALQWHVVHFIGHGFIDHGNEGNLVLSIPSQTTPGTWDRVPWKAEPIFNNFRNARVPPRLVVLNACRTGQADGRGMLVSVADAFLRAEVPAVISMGADVSGVHAVAFSRQLYTELAKSPAAPLDVAVASARQTVANPPGGSPPLRDWALPALDVRVPPDEVIQVPPCLRELKDEMEKAPFFDQRRRYVDRRETRTELWETLALPGPTSQVLAIAGERSSGKSALAHLVVERCLIGGHEARYVSFANIVPLDVLDLLKGIVNGQPFPPNACRLTDPLTGPAVDAFRQRVQDLDRQHMADETTRKDVFRLFKQALIDLSISKPVVIVVDQLEGMNVDDFTAQARGEFLTWHATGLQHPIRLILVVNADQRRAWRLEAPNLLEMPWFTDRDWRILTKEYVRRVLSLEGRQPTNAECRAIFGSIDGFQARVEASQRWGPSIFSRIDRWIEDAFEPLI